MCLKQVLARQLNKRFHKTIVLIPKTKIKMYKFQINKKLKIFLLLSISSVILILMMSTPLFVITSSSDWNEYVFGMEVVFGSVTFFSVFFVLCFIAILIFQLNSPYLKNSKLKEYLKMGCKTIFLLIFFSFIFQFAEDLSWIINYEVRIGAVYIISDIFKLIISFIILFSKICKLFEKMNIN